MVGRHSSRWLLEEGQLLGDILIRVLLQVPILLVHDYLVTFELFSLFLAKGARLADSESRVGQFDFLGTSRASLRFLLDNEASSLLGFSTI